MPSIERLIPKKINNYSFTQNFVSVDEFLLFLENEVNAWAKHAEQAPEGICQTIYCDINMLLNSCKSYQEKGSATGQETTNLQKTLERLNRPDKDYVKNDTIWIHSENPLVSRLIECANNTGSQASTAFFNVIVKNSDSAASVVSNAKLGEILAYNYLVDEEQYKNVLDQKAERIEAIQERMRNREIEADQDIKTLLTTSQDTIQNFQDSFREHLRLSKPAEYWSKSAEKYGDSSALWFGVLVLLILTGVAGFAHFYSLYLSGQDTGVTLDTVKGIVLFVSGITIYGFLIRVVSKMLMSATHLKRDSEERAQLTYFYLALIKDGAIDEQSRDIVIQSLFSRTETGLITGDSSPTMPAMDVLKNIKIGN